MKVLVFSSLLVVAISASFLEEQGAKFQAFKLEHGKSYLNQAEETKRFNIFKDNVRAIEEHNALYEQGKVSYKKDNIVEAENQQANRRLFQRLNPFELFSETQFVKEYHLTKALARRVIQLLDPFREPPTRNSAIDKQTKVLISLQFFASGSYQRRVGHNIFSAVSQPTVSRCIEEVVNAMNRPEIFSQFVRFPGNLRELHNLRRRFSERFNIPGIVGVIDGTQVAIVAPPRNDEHYPEHIYINRKNYHSLNVQVVCDIDLKIINVNARFPGNTHDAYIWNHSQVERVLRDLYRRQPGFYLIGDSGYPLRPWLQVPYRNPEPLTPEFQYNEDFKRARSIVERCIGLLKMRFRCLLKHRTLHYSPPKAGKIVNACVMLHNICIENNVPMPELEDWDIVDLGVFNFPFVEEQQVQQNADFIAGRNLRNNIAQNYYRQQ